MAYGGRRPGSGRKSKSEELKLAEKLEDASDDIIAMMKSMALKGDKDMIKLYMGYMYGNPKVKTENDTTMNISSLDLKNIVSFDNDTSNDLFEDFDMN